jgi:molybdopterin/thiamine biosynthesis adenylyltransferase
MLTNHEIERYDRQLLIEDVGTEGQKKLKNAHVFIAGAGGLGAPILFFLSAAGVGRIRVVDHGLVELSNLNRQVLYKEEDIGQTKVKCAQKTLKRLNPCIEVEGISKRIKKNNVRELVGACDVIVDALDNFTDRYLLNQVAFENRIPLVHGAVESFYGQCTTIIPGRTNCLGCLFPIEPSKQAWPIIGSTCGLIASIQAAEVIKYILGIGDLLENRLLIVNGLYTKFEELTLEREAKCQICNNQ